ncbi:hypothetical protein GGI15_004260 [Coemansia interrupta]|uniref:Uncharacterized protein n=1 Tax=Coemansia interrupta TaxID=1126814 RepID=A0A9W8H4Q1_9FUNG|nr:hypothetical protein GGI15_004260 [Coemansia interrupta]
MAEKKRKQLLSVGMPTLLNLKAEIDRAKTESARPNTDADGKRSRPAKRLRVSDRRNKGIEARAHGDLVAQQQEEEVKGSQTPTNARIRQALEEKAKIYDMLSDGRGVSKADLDDERIARILEESSVDFVGMMMQRRREEQSRGADEMVDVIDEFGRTRRVARSKAHQYGRIVQADSNSSSSEGSSDSSSEDSDSSSSDYNSSRSSSSDHDEWVDDAGFRRNHAPGYYRLSTDHRTRKRQLKELRQLHKDTVAHREAVAATRAEQQQEQQEHQEQKPST